MPRHVRSAASFALRALLVSLFAVGGCASSAPSGPEPPGNPRMSDDAGMMPLPVPPDLSGIDMASTTPRPDLAGMAACRTWPQSGCPAGFKCTTTDYTSTTCEADGQDARGARCTQAPDSCKAGSLCYRDADNGATQCRQFCSTNADCGPRTDCLIDLNAGRTLKVCTQACDPLNMDSCASGHACYLYDAEHSDCVAPGPKPLNATCMNFFNECQAGLTCIAGRCRQVCKRTGGNCGAGLSCVAVDKWTTYGACCPGTGC
jgi:hypothetical protein